MGTILIFDYVSHLLANFHHFTRPVPISPKFKRLFLLLDKCAGVGRNVDYKAEIAAIISF